MIPKWIWKMGISGFSTIKVYSDSRAVILRIGFNDYTNMPRWTDLFEWNLQGDHGGEVWYDLEVHKFNNIQIIWLPLGRKFSRERECRSTINLYLLFDCWDSTERIDSPTMIWASSFQLLSLFWGRSEKPMLSYLWTSHLVSMRKLPSLIVYSFLSNINSILLLSSRVHFLHQMKSRPLVYTESNFIEIRE